MIASMTCDHDDYNNDSNSCSINDNDENDNISNKDTESSEKKLL